jgi:hypothetical protein
MTHMMPPKKPSLKLSLAIKLLDLKDFFRVFGDCIHNFDRTMTKRVLMHKRKARKALFSKNLPLDIKSAV